MIDLLDQYLLMLQCFIQSAFMSLPLFLHMAMWPPLPYGASYAVDVVDCPETLRPALRRLLRKVAVVDDVPAARSLLRNLPDITCTTRGGDVLGAHFAYGGSDAAPSLIEVQSAVDEAAVKALQGKPFFRAYQEATRRAGGGEIEVIGLESIAETAFRG